MSRRSRPRDMKIKRQDDTGTQILTTTNIPTPTDTNIPTDTGAVETAPLPSGTGQVEEPLPSDTTFVQIYSDVDNTVYVQAGIDGNLYLTILDVPDTSNQTFPISGSAIATQDQEPTATTSGPVPSGTSATDDGDDDSDGGLDTSTFFQSDLSGMVTGDYNGRLFHMYQGEMDTYNVSRIRLHDEDSLPVSSVLV